MRGGKECPLIPNCMLSHPEKGVLPILREDNKLPIRTELLSGEIFLGGFVTCLRLTIDGKKYAVKVHKYTGPELDKIIEQEKGDYEHFKRGPLSEYILETQFVKGHGLDGEPCQIAIQLWIEGRKVGEIGVDEILGSPKLLGALKQFQIRMIQRYTRERQWLDYVGFGLKPENRSLLNRINCLSLLASRNLIWDGDRLWLTDTTNHWWFFNNQPAGNKMTFWRLNRRRLAMAAAMARDCCLFNWALIRGKNKSV